MEHISQDDLAIYAFSPDAVPPERRGAIERHVAECASCRSTLDFFCVGEEDLGDAAVWERAAGSATLDSLMAYAERIAEEDTEAEELLAPLFASPGKAAWTNLLAQRRYRTGGVVRKLSAHAHETCQNEPLVALTFADNAVSLSEALPDDAYPAKAVYELRGTAWKERANALMLLGKCAEALESLGHAERSYKRLVSPSLGLAAVALGRASVLYQQQRLDEAAAAAEEAEHRFAHVGDDSRRMTALFLRGSILFEHRNFAEAAAVFSRILEYGNDLDDVHWVARASNALGKCHVRGGNLPEASLHFHKALVLLREIGPVSERLSAEWGVSLVLLHSGKPSEAVRRLRDIGAEFERRGMVTDAALVGLDIADGLLALGRTKQIVELAAHIFRAFTDAGMLTGALTAIAYIRDTAAARTLTSFDLDAVRGFLRRAEKQPELLFALPENR